MYTIIGFDIINGGRTTKKFCNPIKCRSIDEIDDIQEKMQLKYQQIHHEAVTVYCFYKVPVKEHIPHR
jgi:hypothetical protein